MKVFFSVVIKRKKKGTLKIKYIYSSKAFIFIQRESHTHTPLNSNAIQITSTIPILCQSFLATCSQKQHLTINPISSYYLSKKVAHLKKVFLPSQKSTLFSPFAVSHKATRERERERMCRKETRSAIQKSSMINNGETVATLKPARKIRTRTRKPKYLSLRLKLSAENSQDSGQKPHQLNLFPLHPEEKDMHDENVACLLASHAGATLTGLLEDGGEVAYSEDGSLSQSLTYVYEGHDSLVRTALRSKERDSSEKEKWVSYSEVVEKKEEEVNSCPADRKLYKDRTARGSLLLKLDYQVVMNAWSDKGPLYVQADCGQIVPDVYDDFTAEDDINVRSQLLSASF